MNTNISLTDDSFKILKGFTDYIVNYESSAIKITIDSTADRRAMNKRIFS